MTSCRAFMQMYFGRGPKAVIGPLVAALALYLAAQSLNPTFNIAPAVVLAATSVAMAADAIASWSSRAAAIEMEAVCALPVTPHDAIAGYAAAALAHGALTKLVPLAAALTALGAPAQTCIAGCGIGTVVGGATFLGIAAIRGALGCPLRGFSLRTRRALAASAPGSSRGSACVLIARRLMSSGSILANTAGFAVMALALPLLLGDIGPVMGVPIGLAILSINTPLCTVASGEPDLSDELAMLPDSGRMFFIPYAGMLFGVFLATDGLFLASWALAHGLDARFTVLAALMAGAAACASAALERFRPVRGWSAESDLWRHPRKYLVPFALLLLGPIASIALLG
ncbi:hypothetical protein [Collinsella ihumii]|uniref:Uncharacterized protein n=1 Tax=Collinsella ihumii TaxID=1720204 RepID=A0ABT7XC05_9ACTN|nr:hypothetical protein [Collinsella ihumii]MDN0062940.1 hypothetical protein [Collinsella ihumii]